MLVPATPLVSRLASPGMGGATSSVHSGTEGASPVEAAPGLDEGGDVIIAAAPAAEEDEGEPEEYVAALEDDDLIRNFALPAIARAAVYGQVE